MEIIDAVLEYAVMGLQTEERGRAAGVGRTFITECSDNLVTFDASTMVNRTPIRSTGSVTPAVTSAA
jgi:hypothetical protein